MYAHQRTQLGWALLSLACLGVLVLIWRRARQAATLEGFQTSGAPRDLNVDYPLKEVYLVAPLSDVYGAPGSISMTSAGSQETAKATCAQFGAELATLAQVQKAADLSGSWCAPGWTADSATQPYSVQSGLKDCGNTIPLGAYAVPVATGTTPKGYAICYGVKPPFPTAGVQSFNRSDYNMVSAMDLVAVTDGTPDELVPFSFKPAQALSKIDELILKGPPGGMNIKRVRAALIADLNTNNLTELNKRILAVSEPGYVDELTQSCSQLASVANEFKTSLVTLKSLYQDISGGTYAAISAKTENSSLQQRIATLCKNETETTSPGCARLAEIDYTVYYGKDAAPLVDLEGLNYALMSRECELQNVMAALKRVSTGAGCPYDATLFGDNPDETVGCDVDDRSQTAYPNAFRVGKQIGFNAVEELKRALQEIAPYITSTGFQSTMEKVLSRLSYILRIPTLGDYQDVKQDMADIVKFRAEVQNGMGRLR